MRLGHTRVLAAVSAELGAPFPDRPTEGALNFLVECPPMGHAGWDVGRPPDEAAEISRLLERTLRDTGAVDTEALCVLAGRAVPSPRPLSPSAESPVLRKPSPQTLAPRRAGFTPFRRRATGGSLRPRVDTRLLLPLHPCAKPLAQDAQP